MNSADLKINNLSPHLFWDIDMHQLDANKNIETIIQRVLQYGLLKDWLMIYNFYGLQTIVSVVKQLRDLDDKSIAFISSLSKIPREEFLCYTIKQSIPKHWNF